MRFNAMCVRVVAVSLLVVGCLVVPSVPAAAAEDGGQTTAQAPADDAGVVQMLIEWVEGVILGTDPINKETGPTVDPAG